MLFAGHRCICHSAQQSHRSNPTVGDESGMLHLLGRRCLILKHESLKTLQTDILMKLYQPFSQDRFALKNHAAQWVKKLSEEGADSE